MIKGILTPYKLRFLLGTLLFLVGTMVNAQSRFKMEDDSVTKAVRLEEQHKLAGIERLVEATRSFENLEGGKEYTILAPNNRAFKKLPIETIDYLIDPMHATELSDLLACHTLIGRFSDKQIRKKIEKGEGKAVFNTLAGHTITATLDKEDNIIIMDKSKRKMKIIEVNNKKGEYPVHIIDGVILPYNAVY